MLMEREEGRKRKQRKGMGRVGHGWEYLDNFLDVTPSLRQYRRDVFDA